MAHNKEHKEAEDVVAATAKTEKKEKKEKRDKKEKKEKKEKKRSETDGVHKSKDKSEKKEKKHKKEKLAQALEAHLQASAAASVEAEEKAKEAKPAAGDKDMPDADVPAPKQRGPKPIIRGALVEFARPLAADKYQKKVLKIVKRAAKQQALLRGVKEVNKALRKATPKNPAAKDDGNVPGVVVIAGDVNPAEVIMHLPLACEDVSAPYVFVVSRGELGQAARTKRPTSVVMVKAEGRAAKKGAAAKKDEDEDEDDDEDSGSYADQYKEFVQLVQKEYARQMKGLI